jgi:hypothetical protein
VSRPGQIAAALVAVSAGCSHPEAVVNKISTHAGRGAFQSVGGFIRAIFDDPVDQAHAFMLLTAVVAAMFLAAIVTVGLGALQAVRGDRGGSDVMVGGVYGLIALLVMFAVIL